LPTLEITHSAFGIKKKSISDTNRTERTLLWDIDENVNKAFERKCQTNSAIFSIFKWMNFFKLKKVLIPT